jgi:hypothetical protein
MPYTTDPDCQSHLRAVITNDLNAAPARRRSAKAIVRAVNMMLKRTDRGERTIEDRNAEHYIRKFANGATWKDDRTKALIWELYESEGRLVVLSPRGADADKVMDQLARAKLYYFLAMRETILDLGDQFYNYDLVHSSMLQKHPNAAQRPTQLIKSSIFFRICLEDFIKYRWVDSIGDEFAPLFIRRNDHLLEAPAADREFQLLHDKYEQLGPAKDVWLDTALASVLDKFDMDKLNAILAEIGLKDTEFSEDSNAPAASDGDWSPIPLDRSDSEQSAALGALEKTVEELRGDNGYATTNPEEKAFVQDKLSAVARRLKDDSQISWMYLNEFALKPLGILIKRFGKAAIGITASAAREALFSWLKSKGLHFLNGIF